MGNVKWNGKCKMENVRWEIYPATCPAACPTESERRRRKSKRQRMKPTFSLSNVKM
jgi:hypothetical protein